MDLNEEFRIAQDRYYQLLQQGLMTVNAIQKHQLILDCLQNKFDKTNLSDYNTLTVQDIENLSGLNPPDQVKWFIKNISNLQASDLQPGLTQSLEGLLDIKGKTLGRWKTKRFLLSVANKTFELPRKKTKKNKPPRLILLPYYSFKLKEQKKDNKKRFRFVLSALQSGKGYYKKLECGSYEELLFKKTVEQLMKLCQSENVQMAAQQTFTVTPPPQRYSIGPMVKDNSEEKPTGRMFQSMAPAVYQQVIYTPDKVLAKDSSQKIENSGDIRMEQKFTFTEEAVFHQKQETNKKEQKQETLKKESKQIQNTVNLNHENSIKVGQQINLSEELKIKKVESKEENKSNDSNEPNQLVFEEQRTQPVQQKYELVEQEVQSNKNGKPLQTITEVLMKENSNIAQPLPDTPIMQTSRDDIKILNNLTQIQEVANEDFDQFQDFQEEHNEEVDDDSRDNIPSIFQNLQDAGKLTESYLHASFPNSVIVYSNKDIEIWRSQTNNLQFRTTLNLKSKDIDRVFQALAEIEFAKKWNGNINSNESKFLTIISEQRSAIIYEKRKQYGMFYLPRDYIYLRYFYEKDGGYYIVDKSIEHEDCPQYFRVIRGEINYQITSIQKKEDSIQVIMETEVTNGGFSSAEQDGQITQVYIQELCNLQKFMDTYETQQLIESPLLSALQKQLSQSKKKIQFVQLIKNQHFEQIPDQSPVHMKVVKDETKETKETFASEPERKQQIQKRDSMEEELEQIHQLQHRLSFIPNTGTFKPKEKEGNEVQSLEKMQLDEDESLESPETLKVDFVPTKIMTSNNEEISDEYKDHILKQIKSVQQENYFSNCLTQKYINEPLDLKDFKTEYLTKSEGGHFFLKRDWERNIKSGGLVFYNPKKVEDQKRVIKFMLKKIGSNLLQGKSLLSISLPVYVFETRSNLERFAYSFVYAPRYLEEGAKMKSPEEQIKMTVTFGLTSIVMYLSLEKPFNPILGETYQGFIHGCPVYVEQISHHPPICAFQLIGRGYTLDGHIESFANMHANSVTGKNIGFLRVTYHNTKAKQIYTMVPGTFCGTAFGERNFNLNGKGVCIDQENHLVWEGIFNPGKSAHFGKKTTPIDFFQGNIFKVRPQAIQKLQKEGYLKYQGIDQNKDVVQRLNTTLGIWNEYIEIDGEQTWNLKEYPYALTNHPNPLPSDSNYRLDMLYWKLKDFDNSQRTKEILEIKQRNEKKLREKHGGKKH